MTQQRSAFASMTRTQRSWRHAASLALLSATTFLLPARIGAIRQTFSEPASPQATLLFESFENTVPPSGWTRTTSAPVPFTWHGVTDSSLAHHGVRVAAVDWTSTVSQDERLTTPNVDLSSTVSGQRLTFWWFGNPYWSDFADFIVSASSDGSTFTDLWKMSDLAETGNAWRFADLSLAAYAAGSVRVRFRYLGTDGESVSLDEVSIVADETPPPVPENDTCAGAFPNHLIPRGPFTMLGSNLLATHHYALSPSGSCTGFAHTGKDLAYVVDMNSGDTISATMETAGDWDDTLFLVTDCANPQGTCVAGANSLPDGSTITYTHTAFGTGRYYLIASGYGTASGAFTLRGELGPPASIEATTWGRIKAAYR